MTGCGITAAATATIAGARSAVARFTTMVSGRAPLRALRAACFLAFRTRCDEPGRPDQQERRSNEERIRASKTKRIHGVAFHLRFERSESR
jgi:hypothetical protein